MEKIKSLSDKRLIVEVEINGKLVPMLVDTGASVALIHEGKTKRLGLAKGRKAGTMAGAGGEFDAWHCRMLARIGGKDFGQFLIADIGSVVDSIERETGIEIAGIISLPQMKMLGMDVDANDSLVIIE